MGETRSQYLLVLVSVISFIIPLVIYSGMYGTAATVMPEEAISKLNAENSEWVLLDIQEQKDYEACHISGAVNIPLSKILNAADKGQLPEETRRGNLFLLCKNGISSAAAVKKLQKLSVNNVYHVDGGITKWRTLTCEGDPFCSLSVQGESRPFPVIIMPMYEQLAVVISAFFLKPIYMLISFIIILLLRKEEEDDLKIFKWAMVFFFTGEAFCSVNYLFFNEESYIIEYFHMFGMVLSFGLTALAVFKGFDERILHIRNEEKKCSFLSMCGECYKYNDVPCKMKRFFRFVIPAMIIISFMPLLAEIIPVSYNSEITGNMYSYIHPKLFQLFEVRYLPLAAITLFLLSLATLRIKDNTLFEETKIFFSLGAGFLGFCFFRLIFLHLYQSNLTWFVCWEEITEFLFMGGSILFIWIFRKNLLSKKAQ